MSKIYILHENPEWIGPLRAALESVAVSFEFWNVSTGCVDFGATPPAGVFYSRMSASAHSRGHDDAASFAAALLAWLESHNRRVINGLRGLDLELSKARQYGALMAAGVRVPLTRVAVGSEAIAAAADGITFPVVLKPNRGGKGLGVQKVDSAQALQHISKSGDYDAGPDGAVLIQQYIESAEGYIVRNEYVGGRLLYALRVDTSTGFELCPADACVIDETGRPINSAVRERFEILPDFRPPDDDAYLQVLANHNIDIAGIELIFDRDGTAYTYDINVNTNFNSDAESRAGLDKSRGGGMFAIAQYLSHELQRLPNED